MKTRLILALLPALFLGACAIGNKYDYRTAVPEVQVQTDKQIAVGVSDLRSYVITGDKTPQFIGLQRGGYGNPFDVTTESGEPMAHDMTNAITQALKDKGLNAEAVYLAHGAEGEKKALLAKGADKSLLVTLSEWKSDTFFNTSLVYAVTVEVYDNQGTALASAEANGNQDLGGSGAIGHASTAAPAAFRRVLSDLLKDPKIVQALE